MTFMVMLRGIATFRLDCLFTLVTFSDILQKAFFLWLFKIPFVLYKYLCGAKEYELNIKKNKKIKSVKPR